MTCDRPADTPFCPHCGERRAADRVYTLRALTAELSEHVTAADGRAVRSLWTLVRRPGALTSTYMRGVRQPYLTPLGLFLFVNAGYFVYVGVTGQNTFTTPLRVHVAATPYAPAAARLVARRLAERHVTFEAYARRFDPTAAAQAKSLVGAMVPGFALLVAAVELRRRRPVLQHLTFSLHAMAALLVVLMTVGLLGGLALGLAARRYGLDLGAQRDDNIVSSALALALATWLTLGLRHAYGDGPLRSVVKGIGLAFGTACVVSAYRALLFFTTFWAT
ncbi:hypothetical protein tb265_31910 [Gemmatimonadetes bacterium T265]|nr:hypothetical protein tb265_31910 [Gemmatimonadetes bacterium T265]